MAKPPPSLRLKVENAEAGESALTFSSIPLCRAGRFRLFPPDLVGISERSPYPAKSNDGRGEKGAYASLPFRSAALLRAVEWSIHKGGARKSQPAFGTLSEASAFPSRTRRIQPVAAAASGLRRLDHRIASSRERMPQAKERTAHNWIYQFYIRSRFFMSRILQKKIHGIETGSVFLYKLKPLE
jgi:hypothetical protein